MNLYRALSLFVLFILVSFCGGCAGAPKPVRFALLSDPAAKLSKYYTVFSLSIVNNTEAALDIEVLGRTKKANLAPGGTYVYELHTPIGEEGALVDRELETEIDPKLTHYDLHSFRKGDQVTIVAKGYDNNRRFLGTATKTASLGSDGYWHDCPMWVVSEIIPSTKIGTAPEGKKGG